VSAERNQVIREITACLGTDKPAGELVDCVSRHFPSLDVNREQDDLILKGGEHYLVVRRCGPSQFRVSENVAAPSTNALNLGGGAARSLEELVNEIATLAD
jgi:hypothetical protein